MTAIEKYLAELNKQKQLAESRFSNLTSFQNQLLNSSYAWLLNNLNLQNGKFDIPSDLPGLMNGFVDNILKLADKSAVYEKAVNNYISDLSVINQNITEFHSDFNEIAKNKPGVKDVQKAVVTEVIDQYSENGLNKHFVQPLRDLMFSNILAGMSQSEAKEYLKQYIAGGKDESGKLQQYLEQTAQQGVDSYTGAINMKLKNDYDFTGYVISGSLIDTSSKQCIYAIETSDNGYLSFEDWAKVLQMAKENKKAKLIEGTTIDNLPLNKLHWGCRHEFTPIIKESDIKAGPKGAEKPKPTPKPKPAPKEPPKREETAPVKTEPKSKDLSFKDNKAAADYLKEKGIVKDANIKDLTLETATKTAQVFSNVYEQYDLNPINLLTINKGKFRARANGGKIEIQSVSIEEKEKDAKIYLANKERAISIVEANIEANKKRLENKPDYSTQKFYERQIEASNKQLADLKGFTRWTVDPTVEGTIIHEFGHVINDQATGAINKLYFLKYKDENRAMTPEAVKFNADLKKLYKKVKGSEEKYKLSEYGMYNEAEMFAEGFVLYFTGRKNELPNGLEKYFDEYLKIIKK